MLINPPFQLKFAIRSGVGAYEHRVRHVRANARRRSGRRRSLLSSAALVAEHQRL